MWPYGLCCCRFIDVHSNPCLHINTNTNTWTFAIVVPYFTQRQFRNGRYFIFLHFSLCNIFSLYVFFRCPFIYVLVTHFIKCYPMFSQDLRFANWSSIDNNIGWTGISQMTKTQHVNSEYIVKNSVFIWNIGNILISPNWNEPLWQYFRQTASNLAHIRAETSLLWFVRQ